MAEAHKEQKRKSDDSPFIVHPLMVALKLAKAGFNDIVIAAALTHDVLEDTNFPEERLQKELGEDVFKIVKTVSEDKTLAWEDRKQRYIEAVRNGSEEVKAVSIGDKIHNLESLLIAYSQIGEAVWEKFNRGKDKKIWFERAMLDIFRTSWKHPLIDEYAELVAEIDTLR
jgi:(p)ppGpp synthase/HD superfamily hydrolase